MALTDNFLAAMEYGYGIISAAVLSITFLCGGDGGRVVGESGEAGSEGSFGLL